LAPFFTPLTLVKTRTLVRCEALITQLVFEHALRIRVKAETAEKTSSSGTSTPADTERPSPIEQEDSNGSGDETLNSVDADTMSRDETLQASSSSIKSTTSSKAKDKAKDKEVEEKPTAASENLVGKITNLVPIYLSAFSFPSNLNP
jgi:hypothetical protein